MSGVSREPEFEDVLDAAERLSGHAVKTPVLESEALNTLVGGRLLLKAEPLQRTGSFKFRGAYNRISRIEESERQAGVVAFSSGNHAQGVAAAAQLLETPAVIVMPDNAPRMKREGTERWGAEIATYDPADHDSREIIANEIVATRGGTLVRPFDDRYVIAGQGTVGLELARSVEAMAVELDAVLVPCGGGGLTAGIATALDALSPGTTIHTVEPEGFDDTARSLGTGSRERNSSDALSFCDALLAPSPGELTFAVNRRLVSSGLAVGDNETAAAMALAFQHLKLVIEPGGAVALAAALSGRYDCKNRCVAVVVSGGNVDPSTFAEALKQVA